MNYDLPDMALERWKISKPDEYLTGGTRITGDNFVNLSLKYKIFSNEKKILELGPGYGRVLDSIINKKIPFKFYTGIDTSKEIVEYLARKYTSPNIEFIPGSFSEIVLSQNYDVVISTLVLKHQYPTFFESLRNIIQFVNNKGKFFFDLPENTD